MSYISTIYNTKDKPYTNYPPRLVNYLYKRLGMHSYNILLDVGCGRGEYLELFENKGLHTTGIDCEKVIDNCKIIEVNVENEKIPCDNNYFDYIFSKSLIEHLYNPDNFMKECYRVLKPGGKLLVMTPYWEKQMKVFYEYYNYVHTYTRNGIRDLLKIYEFKDIKSEIFYQYPACWNIPLLKYIKLKLSIPFARLLTKITKIKYFRWINETMILGVGEK